MQLREWGSSDKRSQPSGDVLQSVLAKGELMAAQAAAASQLNIACFAGSRT